MKKKNVLIIMATCMFLLGGCNISNSQDVSEMVSDTQEEVSEEKNEENVYSNTEELEDEVNTEASEFIPNYYHSVSDTDETSVYLGGVGGVYRIDSESGVQTLYSAPHIVGAALYENYVFALEYTATDNGMTVALIRINKEDSTKEVVTQVSSGCYDLKMIDNMLILSEEVIGDYGLETVFQAYTLDDKGDLTSDIPQDVYTQFVLPEGDEEGMRLLIDPWFSTKYFDYVCFTKVAGVIDINSVWIRKKNEESAEEIITCVGEPLMSKDKIFYCDSDEKRLLQHSLDNSQDTVLYEIPDDENLVLFTYDDEWVYFLQKAEIDEFNELSSSIMRVNLQDHRVEKIYELQSGSAVYNFNVYDNNCYFILSDADSPSAWICCNLADFTIVEIHSLIK